MKALGIVAGLFVIGIVFTSIVWQRPFKVGKSYVLAPNPLEVALNYDLSDECFEELVKKAPTWVNHTSFAGKKDESVLSYVCAILFTNHAKILIENGADVEQARVSLKKKGYSEALQLLEQVYSNYETTRGLATNHLPSVGP